ncbi:MAG: serine/threonine-protein kinase [Rubripirellula sp.]
MNDNLCSQCSRPLPPDAPELLCPYCLLALGETEPTEEAGPRGRFSAPDLTELQQHFDHHQLQITALIGSGGMGAVYHARQTHLMRDVALKVLPPELASSPGFDERFIREARVLARLDHANVVDVYDFGTAEPYSYLIMEYVDGVNLRDLMLGGEMNSHDALEIIPQLCDALQYAHDQGIVHRDIKPENILVDQQGRVRITDFGLAKLAGPENNDLRLTGTHQLMGTPSYMAPEQIEKPRQVDHRADIYALGVVFYELLTGELPLGRFDPPSRKGSRPRRLDKVVMKTLEKEPDRRYEQASDVKSDVNKATAGDPASRTAKQAADFVVDSASSAQASIAAMAGDHAIVRPLGFLTAVVCFYLSLLIVIMAVEDAPVVSVMFGLGAILLASVAALMQSPISNPILELIAKPPLWIADRTDALLSLVRERWSSTGPSTFGAAISLTVFALSLLFLCYLMDEDDFLWITGLSIFAGFMTGRHMTRKYPEATTRQRWCFLPPILLMQCLIFVPLIIGPAIGVAALLIENENDVRQFLSGSGGEVPHARAWFFTANLILLSFFAWTSFLAILSSLGRPLVRWLAFPFLKDWQGEWSSIVAVATALIAAIFAIGAFSIANG